MTHSTNPIVGVPVMRAVRYPHAIGPDADPDGDIEPVEVTQLTVDTDVKVVGRVTLSAMADPDDAWGFEFDLDPADQGDVHDTPTAPRRGGACECDEARRSVHARDAARLGLGRESLLRRGLQQGR